MVFGERTGRCVVGSDSANILFKYCSDFVRIMFSWLGEGEARKNFAQILNLFRKYFVIFRKICITDPAA